MMKLFQIIGLIFIFLGIVMLLTGGFELKKKKKVLDTEVLDVNAKETRRYSWRPVVSGAIIVGGIALLIAGGRKGRADR
jgi:ABC-type phosphate transport system permease subunit